MRSSPGGRPTSVDCGQKIVSHTLRVESCRRAQRRFEPLEPKEIVVGIARLDQPTVYRRNRSSARRDSSNSV